MSILCYHAVDPAWRTPLAITPDQFARHCAWLSRHRRMIGLPEAVASIDGSGRWPDGLTALSFDDGFAGLHTYALPILLRYQLPATVFVVAQTLTSGGRTVDWVDDPPSWPLRTLSREQILEMRAAGVSFGSHSFSHRDLTTLTEDECEHDLRTSRELLEEVLGEAVRLLAYPRGRHNEAVRLAAARVGFTHAFALPDGPEPIGPHAVPRAGVWSGDGEVALRIKSTNSYIGLRTSPFFGIARTARHLLSRQRYG
jgi:peptidoglycan/xylan/chitin deacetylase (PgdA/CDA1 family)